ncbi:protein CutA homolog isoform X2 [Toxorhynchites rutilus septentrionalis]|uniref:protein CutA homolog isoform X2 n=1 Tax=Toxorhynchites rutilus septentrionalis TaxID=329112 RepID=UPI0024795F5F|nr:protein CutA homolog isoform X2 [Toxorhynchites rutilus septentrionalis]
MIFALRPLDTKRGYSKTKSRLLSMLSLVIIYILLSTLAASAINDSIATEESSLKTQQCHSAGGKTNFLPSPLKAMSTEAPQQYQSGTHSIAYVTTPNENSAKQLARKIVERKLAACVNVIPGLTSIYEWEGKIQEDQEYLLMIKTRTTRVDELSKFVRENHPYSVAEVISVTIENGNPPYLDWLSKTVPEKQ